MTEYQVSLSDPFDNILTGQCLSADLKWLSDLTS